MEIFTAKREFQGKEIVLYGLDSGYGVYAVVVGGDRPHAGASAVADPCEINGKITASLSSVALPGHKDDELCRSSGQAFFRKAWLSGCRQRRHPFRRAGDFFYR